MPAERSDGPYGLLSSLIILFISIIASNFQGKEGIIAKHSQVAVGLVRHREGPLRVDLYTDYL